MTEEKGIKILIQHCDNEIKESGFLIFNKKRISFEQTRLVDQWNREANLALPNNIEFNYTTIDKNGVRFGQQNYEWCDISATGIKSEIVEVNEEYMKCNNYLLLCLNNEKVIEREIGKMEHYYNQLGHFIEQYKLEYKNK
jgi:hypothetical protein